MIIFPESLIHALVEMKMYSNGFLLNFLHNFASPSEAVEFESDPKFVLKTVSSDEVLRLSESMDLTRIEFYDRFDLF